MTISATIDTGPPPQLTEGVTLTTVEQLLILRRRLRLTVPQAAARWGLKVRSIHAWEQGTRRPLPATDAALKRIIRAEERRWAP